MGIMDYFRNRENKKVEEAKEEIQVQKKEKFVADLSLAELDGADWFEFATILKQNKILPPSYVREPISVEVSLDKKNRAKAVIEFKSKTSDSVRKYLLLQDGVFQYVNGAIDDGKNEDLISAWKKYQNEIRYLNMLQTNREGYFHKQRGEKLIKKAEKMMQMTDLYDREQEFLEMYKETVFDDFCYSPIFEKNNNGFIGYAGELPKFIPLEETPDGHYVSGEPVIPFTPRTLEHCILHMTNGQKIEDGEYPEDFEKKCRKLEKYSCFESKDWDKVIEFGKEIVTEKYRESEIAETLGFDRE